MDLLLRERLESLVAVGFKHFIAFFEGAALERRSSKVRKRSVDIFIINFAVV